MDSRQFVRRTFCVLLGILIAAATRPLTAAQPIGGFVPFVGMALTDKFKTIDDVEDEEGNFLNIFFIAEPSMQPEGNFLGPGASTFYDIALLDTGAATHILTPQAYQNFDIEGEDLDGTEIQPIGGATGIINLQIDDAKGVYVAGLKNRTSEGATLTMDNMKLRGQTSFATLSAPDSWKLPNIIGLPMAAQHAIAISNSDPQVFAYQNRTVRTPQVELRDLGTGGGTITRRAELKLRPGIGFIQGPLYVFNLGLEDILGGGGELNLHDNPSSPSVVENGALFVDVDVTNGTKSLTDTEFLFDTGADLTVISQATAVRLGFDAVLDTPDFVLEVEGSGGVIGNVPGIILDSLSLDTIGGSFTLTNIPVAVLDVTNPNDPGNVVPAILGMNAFNGRDLVIDANPSRGQGGVGPSLYISDPVTQAHSWNTLAASGTWATAGNWTAANTSPDKLWAANVANVSGNHQTAVVAANSQVFQLTVSGTPSARMTVQVNSGVTLTAFAETQIGVGGRVEVAAGGKLDTQFVDIDGGTLAGSGLVFAGTGPIRSPVRNLSGRIEPGTSTAPAGTLTIDGDLSQQVDGTLAIDLGGLLTSQYDRLAVGRSAFLDGVLAVSLANLGGGQFMPSVGNSFTILTATGGVFGTFEHLQLPDGFVWDVDYNTNDIILSVTAIGLAGDFNHDGTVNAADYVEWRSGTALASDFAKWRANFGKTMPIGASASVSNSLVPEPTSVALAALAAMVFAARSARIARNAN